MSEKQRLKRKQHRKDQKKKGWSGRISRLNQRPSLREVDMNQNRIEKEKLINLARPEAVSNRSNSY